MLDTISGLRSRQRGMSFVGVVIIVVIAAFFVMLGLRVIPVYLNEYKISSSLKEIQQTPELQTAPPHVLRRRLQDHFNINEVNNVKARQAKIRDAGGGVRIMQLEYDVTKPLFANIRLLFSFKPKARLESR